MDILHKWRPDGWHSCHRKRVQETKIEALIVNGVWDSMDRGNISSLDEFTFELERLLKQHPKVAHKIKISRRVAGQVMKVPPVEFEEIIVTYGKSDREFLSITEPIP